MIIDAVGLLLWQPDRDQKPTAVIGDFTTEHLNQRQVQRHWESKEVQSTHVFFVSNSQLLSQTALRNHHSFSQKVSNYTVELVIMIDFSFKITLSYIRLARRKSREG